MPKSADRKMDRSQLPLLRKKKTSKETVSKVKDTSSLSKKDKAKAFQMKPDTVTSTGCQATFASSFPREEGSPGTQKSLGSNLKRENRVPANGDGVDLVVEEDGRKPRTPIDWEWSKYVVQGGQPSDTYQKVAAEKSVPSEEIQGKAEQVQRRATGLTPPKLQYSQLPQLAGHQCFSATPNSFGDYSPIALHLPEDSRMHSANGKSNHPQVFTFDQKASDDHDSSPIYHELDPLGIYSPSAHHTYQSITEIREEVDRLQTEAANSPATVSTNSGPTRSAMQTGSGSARSTIQIPSGPTRSTIKPDSGSVLSSAQDGSPKHRTSKTLPSHLTRVCAPRSPTLLPGPSSPTVPGHQGSTRSQSIFSKLWLQKKSAHVPKDTTCTSNVTANGDYASTGQTSRGLSLEAVCIDSPSRERNFSPLYPLTSPPPSAATAMTDYYQRLAGSQTVATSPTSPNSVYGIAACKNLPNFYGNAKRSLSDSTASHSLGDRSKTGGKTGVAYENRLPWRTCRDLSPLNGKCYADRWDIVRFGEPLDSHISGGGNVSLETFKSSAKKASPKSNKVCPSSPCYQCPGKSQPSSSALKKDCPPVSKKPLQKRSKLWEETNGRAQEIDRYPERPFPVSRTMVNMSSLSKSQENVLSAFPLDLFSTSPPGSFESLLSEDDVFLPSSNEKLNLLSPPLARTTFSSPSCGVRMAELRAVRRKSDSKSPSPEPPVSTPPPYLPFFQISPAHRSEPVSKQDVAVQTSPVKSPVRLGSKNSHRYMHTIIEEEHLDQGYCADGKQQGSRTTESRTKTTAPDSSQEEDRCLDHPVHDLSVLKPEMDELRKETEASSDNLLQIISEADDDDSSSMDSCSGKIKLSNNSCSIGNLQDGGACTGTTASDDVSCTIRPSKDSPQPVPSSKELASVSDVQRSSNMGGVSVDSDRASRDLRNPGTAAVSIASSEAESATSAQDVQSVSRRGPGSESGRPKGSKLRPPKPAKCIATRIMDGQTGGSAAANQLREDVSELPRYSSQYVRGKVGEIRPFAAPSRQFSDTQPNNAVEPGRTQPIIKQASVRCIDCIATTGHDSKDADSKPCDEQGLEVPRTAPLVPLKSGRSGAMQHKSPVPQRPRIAVEQKKNNIAPSKSQPSILSASGNRDRIETIAANGDPTTPSTTLPETNADCSSGGSHSGSQSLPSKCDSVLTTRHSSLSSSLTSSSSSSVFSIADSESENVAVARSRKDPLIAVSRPSDYKSSPPSDGADKTCIGKAGKLSSNDGKGLEKSRLAVPKVSVTRCKERFEKTYAQKQGKTNMLTSENFCDDDKSKFYSSPSSD